MIAVRKLETLRVYDLNYNRTASFAACMQ
ncbi:hypothetical protein [Sporofaciens musculi]|nr:hypothetical protein [Sporofaciens musculi]